MPFRNKSKFNNEAQTMEDFKKCSKETRIQADFIYMVVQNKWSLSSQTSGSNCLALWVWDVVGELSKFMQIILVHSLANISKEDICGLHMLPYVSYIKLDNRKTKQTKKLNFNVNESDCGNNHSRSTLCVASLCPSVFQLLCFSLVNNQVTCCC